MLLLPLVGDDLLRAATEGVEITFRARADELFQQFAVGHDSLPVSLSDTNNEPQSVVVVPYCYGFFHGIREMFGNPRVSFPAAATNGIVALHNRGQFLPGGSMSNEIKWISPFCETLPLESSNP